LFKDVGLNLDQPIIEKIRLFDKAKITQSFYPDIAIN